MLTITIHEGKHRADEPEEKTYEEVAAKLHEAVHPHLYAVPEAAPDNPLEASLRQWEKGLIDAAQAKMPAPEPVKTAEQLRAAQREALVYTLHRTDKLIAQLPASSFGIWQYLANAGYTSETYPVQQWLTENVVMPIGLVKPEITACFLDVFVTSGDFMASFPMPAPLAEFCEWFVSLKNGTTPRDNH